MQPIDIYDYAAYIAKLCAMKNYFVNLTKLQKLIYCVYGAVLVHSDTRICKEHPKRYPHGPVFPKLYNFAKKHHFDFIDALLNRKENVESNLTDPQIKVVNAVIDFSESIMPVNLLLCHSIITVHGLKAVV